MAKFNQRLQELRNAHQMSQQQLADRLGLSKSSVNMYEHGKREPGLETLEALADCFGVTMDYLMGRTTPPAVPSPAPSEAIGHRIRTAREAAGMTQEELANLAGYTDRSSIAKVEVGRVDLTRSKVLALAAALHVSPAYLLGIEDATTDPALYHLAARLNAAGRDKLIAYAEDLVASGRYAKEDE